MVYTPEFITELKPNEVFVFGSNERGQHGGGAAKQALQWGAKWGVGEGLRGQTYALPTKSNFAKTLSLTKIQFYIDNLEKCIEENEDRFFLITKVGCGLAGLSIEDIAPLFKNFIDLKNCSLPIEFVNIITKIN